MNKFRRIISVSFFFCSFVIFPHFADNDSGGGGGDVVDDGDKEKYTLLVAASTAAEMNIHECEIKLMFLPSNDDRIISIHLLKEQTKRTKPASILQKY